MAFLTVTGIVTRYANYRDNDRILTLFTREMGRIDARARGCRRPKSPLLACSQPFVFGEYQIFAGKDRYTIDQCDVRETFYPLREDMDKFTVGTAMLSLSQHAVQAGEPNPELFSLLYHGLSFLCYGDSEPLDIGLCFLTRYIQVAGFCPVMTSCAVCGKDLRALHTICFNPAVGGAQCDDCARQEGGSGNVSSLTLEAMRRMLLLTDSEINRVRLPDTVRCELYALLDRYTAHVFDHESRPLAALKPLLPKI